MHEDTLQESVLLGECIFFFLFTGPECNVHPPILQILYHACLEDREANFFLLAPLS